MGTTTTPNLGLIKPDEDEPGENWPAQVGANYDTLDGVIIRRVATQTLTVRPSAFTTQTEVMSITFNEVNGQRYKISFKGRVESDEASTTTVTRIKEDSDVGDQKNRVYTFVGASSSFGSTDRGFGADVELDYTALSSGSKTFVVTVDRIVGSGQITVDADSNQPCYLYVDHIVTP